MKFKIQITKYFIVGILNFLLTFVIFTVMLKLFHINYIISLFTSWLAGVLFSYIANFSWVFKPEAKIIFNHRFIKFIIIGFISVVLNMIVLNYIVENIYNDPFFIQLLLIPFIVVFNFIGTKYWSFSLL
jgi:putative flippase GtrA